MPRSLNARAANADPLCEMNVTGPWRRSSGVGNPVARSLTVSCRNPMPLPPHIGMPASLAIAARRSCSGSRPGSGGTSSYSEEKVTSDRAPAATASRAACSMRWFATPRIARSGACGTAPIDG